MSSENFLRKFAKTMMTKSEVVTSKDMSKTVEYLVLKRKTIQSDQSSGN